MLFYKVAVIEKNDSERAYVLGSVNAHRRPTMIEGKDRYMLFLPTLDKATRYAKIINEKIE